MKRILILAFLLAPACAEVQDETVDEQDSTAVVETRDTGATATGTAADGGQRRAAAPTQFDARAVKRGDRFGDLTVAQVQLQPAATESGSSGSVKFSGQTEVVGSYRAHFDYPEVKVPCFWLDVESWSKLPRARNDQRILWFCFSNQQQVIEQLGALGSQARATIVIDDYTTNLSGSDAWDTARLVRVVKKEAF